MRKRLFALLLALMLAVTATCLADEESGDNAEEAKKPAPEPVVEVTPAPTAKPTPVPEVKAVPESVEESKEKAVTVSEDAGSENPDSQDEDSSNSSKNEGSDGNSDENDFKSDLDNDQNDNREDDNSGDDNNENDNDGDGEKDDDGNDDNTEDPDKDPEDGLIIRIATEGASKDENSVWLIPYSADEDIIRFIWTEIDGAESYEWVIANADGSIVKSSISSEAILELTAGDYAEGNFTLTVRPVLNGEQLEASLTFMLTKQAEPSDEKPDNEKPDDKKPDDNRPGGDSANGGRPSGGFGGSRGNSFSGFSSGGSGNSGGSAGAAGDGAQGSRVTPGEALTSYHSSGTKDMSAYGTVALYVSSEGMTQLTVGGVELDACLSNGNAFAAEIQEGALILSSDAAANEWVINALTLKILQRSGIDALELRMGDESVTISTDLEFSGACYAAYREQGYVSKDFDLHIGASETTVVVSGESCILRDGGELVSE